MSGVKTLGQSKYLLNLIYYNKFTSTSRNTCALLLLSAFC